MASVLTNYWGNLLLQALATSGGYLTLFEEDPTVTGDLTKELAGYTRALVTFSDPSSKSIASTNGQIITGMPESNIRYLGICDSIAAGHLLCYIDLVALGFDAIPVPAQGYFETEIGDIAIGL